MSGTRPIRHLLSGAVFPGPVPGFLTGEPSVYDDWGHDVSVAYAWPEPQPDTQITVYVVAAAGRTDVGYLEDSVSAIYRFHPQVEVLGHDRATVGGHTGVRVDMLIPGEGGDAPPRPSTIHVFAVDDWLVKVRATASSASPGRAVALSSEALLKHFGWPRPRQQALARLEADRTRAAEALAAFDEVCRQRTDDGEVTRILQQAKAYLAEGSLAWALRRFAELTQDGQALPEAFGDALQAYLPASFRLGAGLGTSPADPIVIETETGGDAWLAVAYRYLGSVLGERLIDWDVEACHVAVAESGFVDALVIQVPTGERATVFVAMPDTGPLSSGHGQVLARWERTDGTTADDAFPRVTIPDELPEALADLLNLHLWSHTAHWMLTRQAD